MQGAQPPEVQHQVSVQQWPKSLKVIRSGFGYDGEKLCWNSIIVYVYRVRKMTELMYKNTSTQAVVLIVMCLCHVILPSFKQDVFTRACRRMLDVSDTATLYVVPGNQYFLILPDSVGCL